VIRVTLRHSRHACPPHERRVLPRLLPCLKEVS
jgi:hypothetical protein